MVFIQLGVSNVEKGQCCHYFVGYIVVWFHFIRPTNLSLLLLKIGHRVSSKMCANQICEANAVSMKRWRSKIEYDEKCNIIEISFHPDARNILPLVRLVSVNWGLTAGGQMATDWRVSLCRFPNFCFSIWMGSHIFNWYWLGFTFTTRKTTSMAIAAK